MPSKRPLQSLPLSFHTGLLLLERGYYLCHGGNVPPSNLPEKVVDFLNRLEDEELVVEHEQSIVSSILGGDGVLTKASAEALVRWLRRQGVRGDRG